MESSIQIFKSNESIERLISKIKQNPSEYITIMSNLIHKPQNLEKFVKNLQNIKAKVLTLNKETNFDLYQALSCIYGAFLGDSMGSYCEFTKYSESNFCKIFVGNNIFGDPPGKVTDDSEMAMSMSFAIMDTADLRDLDQNLLFFYYGMWLKTNPKDIGNTTRNSLKFFNMESCHIEDPKMFSKFKSAINMLNHDSLSNGFLMRISPFVVWFYFRHKDYIRDVISCKDSKKYYELYCKIKEMSTKDNEIIHSNPEVFASCATFVFMGLCSICGEDSNNIISKLEMLIESESFDSNAPEREMKTKIKDTLTSLRASDFNHDKFLRSICASTIGYYFHGYKLTLYFLVFMSKYSTYESIMHQICNCGGDTDTNAAIVGCVIGPLVGYETFGRNEMSYLLDCCLSDRFLYCSGIMYLFVRYLQETNLNLEKKDNEIRYNFVRMMKLLLETEIDLNN